MSHLLGSLEGYRITAEALREHRTPVLVNGLAAIHKAHFIASLTADLGHGALVLTADEAAATRLMEDINRFLGREAALLYPEREFIYHAVETASREYEQQRLGVLRRLQKDHGLIAVASVTAALQPTVPPDTLSDSILTVAPGMELPPNELLRRLVQAGYERAEQVEGVGQFAARGGIVDFFPPQNASGVSGGYPAPGGLPKICRDHAGAGAAL